MARARTHRGHFVPPSHEDPNVGTLGETTGKFLVVYREDADKQAVAFLKESAGLQSVASAADFLGAGPEVAASAEADIVVFHELGVAVVNGDPNQMGAVSALGAEDNVIIAVEPERMLYAAVMPDDVSLAAVATPGATLSEDFLSYLRGYRDAVNQLYIQALSGSGKMPSVEEAVVPFADTAQYTWGIQATLASSSRFIGQGVKVAILDTGLDLQHPDFQGRLITSQSFIAGQAVQDGHSHGTHCSGTSCGSLPPLGVRRYGCAPKAEIFIGKVLSNAGSGPDSSIIAGINWAVSNQCRIVSMSLSARTQPGDQPSPIYENLARRALAANTLIVAAAGNDSNRPSMIAPVGRPANCPSIMAVAAVDSQLGIAFFSNGGINPNGGGIDIAGPGVNVYSTVPMPARYGFKSGTSMATPHVAGIAALHLQARGLNTSAAQLWQILVSTARRLNLPARDVGAGLVLSPQ